MGQHGGRGGAPSFLYAFAARLPTVLIEIPNSAAMSLCVLSRSMRSSVAHRFRLRDGRIVAHWAVRDDLRAMIQSGVIRPPLPPAG